MATYAVTFRIADKTVGGKTYSDRYDQLMKNLREKDKGYWVETTSFVLVESSLSTDAFGAKAVRGLSKVDDLLFVFDPSDESACYFGAVEHADVLKSFFPKAKKLG